MRSNHFIHRTLQRRSFQTLAAAAIIAVAPAVHAQATQWDWDDGTRQGWGWYGETEVVDGALLSRGDPSSAAAFVIGPALTAASYGPTQSISFDLTLHAVDGAASMADVVGSVALVSHDAEGGGWPRTLYRDLDLSGITAFGQKVRIQAYLGDTKSVAAGDRAYLQFNFFNNALNGIPHRPYPSEFVVDNVNLSPVPEAGALPAAMAGALVLWAMRGWRARARGG